MPWNGSGTFSLTDPPINFQASPISSADMNSKHADLVAGLNNTMARDGQASALTATITKSTQAFIFDGSTSQRATLGNIMSLGALTRAEAAALTVTGGITVLGCYHGGVLCLYEKDASGTALTTADGQKWSPYGGKASPQHWGAASDASVDVSTEFQAAIDYVKASWDPATQSYGAILSGLYGRFRLDTSIDITGVQQNGLEIRDMEIFGRCANRAVLDGAGTRKITYTNVHIYGDPTSAPAAGFLVSRIAENGFLPAPQHRFINCTALGEFTVGGMVNLASEVIYEAGCHWQNTTLDYNAKAAVYCMNPAELTRVTGKTITSDYKTLIDDYEARTLTVVKITGADVRKPHSYTMTITDITEADPGVATYSGTAPAAFGNDSRIFLDTAPGMTSLQQKSYVVKNHDAVAKTFQLYELDGTTTVDTTGAGSLSSNGALYNMTGPALFLNGVSLFDWDGYMLAYGDNHVTLAAQTSIANEGLFPSAIWFRVAAERVNQSFLDLDVGTTNRTFRDIKVEFIDLAYTTTLIRRIGTGGVTINGLTLVAGKATGSGLADNICAPASAFTIYQANISFGNNNYFNAAGWAAFRGIVQEPRGVSLYGMDRLTFAGNGQTLTEAGLRKSGTSRYSLYREGVSAERFVQYSDAATQANLRDITHRVNIEDKYPPKMVWDSTNLKPVWAAGAAQGAVWVNADGTTAHTPT